MLMAPDFWRLSPFIEHRKIEKSQKGATFVTLLCVQQLERFSFSAPLIPLPGAVAWTPLGAPPYNPVIGSHCACTGRVSSAGL